MSDLSRLCNRLDYSFKNSALLKQALTHRSANSENNERFEFLGDALLSTIISHALFKQCPKQTEGQLSRLRANLVKKETLASIALALALGDHLILGQGELKSGGFRRASILADALEALLAAVFIDGGFHACEHVILNLYQTRLEGGLQNLHLKDSKTLLQEYLQALKHALPIYTLTKVTETEQDSIFYITCTLAKLNLSATGEGETRRKAEQQAAEKLLKALQPYTSPP